MKILYMTFLCIFIICSGQKCKDDIYGSVKENYSGGIIAFSQNFKFKNEYPPSLKKDKIVGHVAFKIEIDTNENIKNFTILSSPHELMSKEVEKNITLTNGKWLPKYINSKKVNYFIGQNVYFELR